MFWIFLNRTISFNLIPISLTAMPISFIQIPISLIALSISFAQDIISLIDYPFSLSQDMISLYKEADSPRTHPITARHICSPHSQPSKAKGCKRALPSVPPLHRDASICSFNKH